MGISSPAKQQFYKINKLIYSSRYNESFLLLKNQMQQYESLRKELEKLKDIESNYRYMLDYIAEGHKDSSRQDMIDQIREDLFYANELVLREITLKDSGDSYSSSRRMFDLRKDSFKSLLNDYKNVIEESFKGDIKKSNRVILASQARVLNELFSYVWTIFGDNKEEYELINNTLQDPDLPEYFKSLILSAITVGNLKYFNPYSYEILINQYEYSDSLNIKAKAIIGILLVGLLNSKRISGNIKLRSRLMIFSEDEELKKLFNETIINIIRTYDTKRIDNKMRNEVIPELMKIKPEIIDKLKNLSKESENFLSDGNPEWENLIDNSNLGNKLKEISDMQLEGADVMVTAFSNLKGFPFFSQISNWFLPFTPGHYEFAALPIHHDDETVLRLSSIMCDSDLHSFLLSASTMPEMQRNQMLTNMQNQMNEAYEAMNNSIGETDSQKLSKKIRHSLQDLYRFFKYYRKKNEFEDPFESPFIFSHFEPLLPVFNLDTDIIKLVAEFYFKNKYYEEAVGFFELVDRTEPGIFSLWEKIGYSYDRLQKYKEAVEWYLKADLVNPNNKWLEKKLAVSLKNAGKPKESLEYYERAIANEPENYHLLMSAGQAYLATGNYQNALKHFYHANYINPEKLDPLRAIAWAELLSGNNEKATLNYNKILSQTQADKTDFLNAAHTALTFGDIKNAIKLYKVFVDKNDKDITALVIALRDDSDTLKKLGIKTSDLRLIVDKIRYDLIS